MGSLLNSVINYIPIVNGIKKGNDLKSIANNIIKSFKIIKNKDITLLNESQTLYDDDFFKITGTAKLGAKIISEKKITTIEYKDKKCTNDNGYFKKINEIYKKLSNMKKNPEKDSYEKDIIKFNENIGNSIINGKLHITVDLKEEEIKLIFEISDTINLANIYGHFELIIKFKKPTFKSIQNYSYLISQKNSINDEETILFSSFLGIITINILNKEEDNLSLFLSWIYAIGNNEDFNLKANNLLDYYSQFQQN